MKQLCSLPYWQIKNFLNTNFWWSTREMTPALASVVKGLPLFCKEIRALHKTGIILIWIGLHTYVYSTFQGFITYIYYTPAIFLHIRCQVPALNGSRVPNRRIFVVYNLWVYVKSVRSITPTPLPTKNTDTRSTSFPWHMHTGSHSPWSPSGIYVDSRKPFYLGMHHQFVYMDDNPNLTFP